MKTYIFLISALILPLFLGAQLQDNFSDGDFTHNPIWSGDVSNFTVDNGALRLFDASPGASNVSYLYTDALTSLSETTTWEFYFRMEFAPSGSNFGRIYLVASNADLSGSQNGYYLKLGGVSGSGDALELYRQDGTSSALLISGTSGNLGTDPSQARVRIIRDTDGVWTLMADYSGGTNYLNEGTATDNTYDLGHYIGYYCKYTSSRAEDFYLDDVFVSPLFEDVIPPELLSVEIVSSTEIIANFDESIDGASLVPTNFSLDNGIGNPISTMLVEGSPSSVLLTFGTTMVNLTDYTLTTNQIADIYGNQSGLQSMNFTYYDIQTPLKNELLITELFPDPIPALGLPEAEFIELYNHSDKVFDLSNVRLKVNTSERSLSNYLLLPGDYVILCKDENVSIFSNYGVALGLESFPSLTNSGSSIQLINEHDAIIYEINYDISWYHDEEKDGGGWSLELIDLDGPYNCGGNWLASKAANGGTPGAPNSVDGEVTDISGPRIIGAIPLSSMELLLTFDEAIDLVAATDFDNFIVSNGLEISVIIPQTVDNQLLIIFTTELQPKMVYQIGVTTAFTDCLGNESPPGNKISFGLPEPLELGDILINEILFNPETGGYDFLELYNVSDKIINLKGLQLFNFQKETGNNATQVGQDYLFFSKQYVVITTTPDDILQRYNVAFPERVIKNSLPSFDNESGNVTIRFQSVTIDSFDYDENMHFPLIDPEGVSLEKIDESLPSYQLGNWHSAASTVGFATPTYRNSQARDPEVEPQSNVLQLLDKVFSPDGDGEEDVLRIGYKTDKAGYVANFAIFDAKGRLVKKSNNNQLLGTQGVFKWDGTNDDKEKVRMGIYIIWAEIFAPDGTISEFKRTCVVAGKLN